MQNVLSVPVYQQPPDSVECGIVSLQMLYEYYNVPLSLETLRKELSTTDIGTYAPQLGLHLINHGFDVTIITQNPKLVTIEDRDNSSKELLEKFTKQMQNKETSDNDRMILQMFCDFLQKGGNLQVKIPSVEDIKQEIIHEKPLIALLQNGSWYTRPDHRPFGDIFHMVVVTGFDEEYIYVNDPNSLHGGSARYAHTEFFYALYSSALGDPDNASLITVKKR